MRADNRKGQKMPFDCMDSNDIGQELSRRELIKYGLLGGGAFLAASVLPTKASAREASYNNNEIMTLEEYLSLPSVKENANWGTYGIDDKGNLVPVSTESLLQADSELLAALPPIGVIGGVLLGYVFGVVVDGIVTAVTGQSTSYWFAQAVKKLVGLRPPITGRVYINCNLYAYDLKLMGNCKFGYALS